MNVFKKGGKLLNQKTKFFASKRVGLSLDI